LRYRKLRHAGLNLFFTFTTILINFAFAALIVGASDYCRGIKPDYSIYFRCLKMNVGVPPDPGKAFPF
jgi:hypothetical protein